MTVDQYGRRLEENLRELHDRIHSGRYRPSPVKRVHIPKADGGLRPLGVPTLEDKIVQGAVAEVLSAIYEADFLGFSYGFRPGKSPHHALEALRTAILIRKVGWVLDADIRKFFDSVDHDWLMRILRHRIADRRVLRLVENWLRAGILEGGRWSETIEGTPQGAGISPLLANIFLHYILDQWIHHWRIRRAVGLVSIVRYCDDFVIGFERESDARRLWRDLEERLQMFSLSLHRDKTRLLPFGRYAKTALKADGTRMRPPTFDFLGFTHYCGKSSTGRFAVMRKTQGKRLIRKLKELRAEMRRRMHFSVREQHRWLSAVLRGHYRYFGVPGNYRCLKYFTFQVRRSWFLNLRRRGGRTKLTWARFDECLLTFPFPRPHDNRPRQIEICA